MRTLRARLTAGVGLVVAVVLVVVGGLVAREVDRRERDALDDRLQRTAELSSATAKAAVEEEVPGTDRRLDAVLRATRTSLRLTLAGRPLFQTGVARPKRPRTVLGLDTFTVGDEHYRAYTTRLRDPDLGGLVELEVITSLASLEDRQAALERRLLVLGVAGLLVAALGVWLAAELVLRPLRRLRALASSIAGDEDLGRRMPTERGPSELRSVAASFNAMLARLGRSAADRERAAAATRRFAADAGHELRTPLTSVLTSLSTLRRHPDADPERRAALLDDALSEHRRLVHLLDGLQAMARGDAGLPEQADLDLAELVDTAAVALGDRHPELTVTCRLPGSAVHVNGWEPGLRLMLDNLLENAARHGRPDGTVVAELQADGTLHVDDDGPGIPADERAHVFEPFVRLDPNGRDGSGLGLALVARQVEQHGGTVTTERSPLGGARFTVRLPVN